MGSTAENDRAEISCLLRELREAAGLSAAALARGVQIPPDSYDRYERGDPSVPLEVLYSISLCLGLDVRVSLSGGKFPMEAAITCLSNGEIKFERRKAEGRAAEAAEAAEMTAVIENELRGGKTGGAKAGGGGAWASPYVKKEKEEQEFFELHKKGLFAIPQSRIIEWQRVYTTGIEFFDKQHKEFINSVNQLYSANIMGWKYSQEVFEKIIRWALLHIQNLHGEEKIMERVGYPARGVHQREHAEFIKEVLKQARTMKAGRKFSAGEFILFSRDWMQSHVGISDRDLASYLIRMKREGKLNGIFMRVRQNKNRRLVVS
jgi:hemerythrin-like metal-binding protein